MITCLDGSLPAIVFMICMALLFCGNNSAVSWIAVTVLASYMLLVRRTSLSGRPRLLINAAMIGGLYGSSGIVIESLGLRDCAPYLMAADRMLFGESPTVTSQRFTSPLINDLLSAGYLSYYVYLTLMLWHLLQVSPERRLFHVRPMIAAYAAGLMMYGLVPATSVERYYAELFPQPLQGYVLTPLVRYLVTNYAAPYDSFPSLHILITGTLLICDCTLCPLRFRLMLIPAGLMTVSTVMLRQHYAVDGIVSVFLLLPYLWIVRKLRDSQ